MSGSLKKILITALAGSLILVLAFVVMMPWLVRSHGVNQGLWCENNIRQIDGAIEMWALEKHLAKGTPVTTNDILSYFRGGIPQCPIGGHYTLTKVGAIPTCSMPSNAHKIVY